MTTLAEALLLLAFDDEKGSVLGTAYAGLDFGLAGAMVAELAARERLRVDGKKLFAIEGPALDHGLLDATLAALADKPGKRVDWWVRNLSHVLVGLRRKLLDGLVAQGVLEHRDERFLHVFHVQRYPERDGHVEHDIRRQLDAVLLDDKAPDARTHWLIQLAAACKVTDVIYPRRKFTAVHQRIKALQKTGDSVAAGAVEAAIQAEQAAVMAAIMAASVAATAAASSSACAAAAAAC
ncbi:MAG TPA: GPP34 family phosphoprotein [Rhodanobacteraceae bacterium]